MKKVLIITTISGFVPQFEMNNVKILQNLNYEVHYASNFKTPIYGDDNRRLDNTGIICHQIDFVKSPFNMCKNILAYKQLKKIFNEEKFDLIHCHTPVGGALGRLVAKGYPAKVIYTAHGFHFYKGASALNWLIYYPIERYLSKHTDILVTINQEDFCLAKSFHTCKVVKIDGVGLKTIDYEGTKINKEEKRNQLGIEDDKFVLCSVGELNKNKNQQVVLQAIQRLISDNIVYLICGSGSNIDYLKELVEKLGISNKVKFLGYRKDVNEILMISDCFIFPSKREGLGMAALEAMASGLPIIVADSRGTREYAIDGKTGFVYKYNDYKGFASGIKTLESNIELRINMSKFNRLAVLKFDLTKISSKMEKVYKLF